MTLATASRWPGRSTTWAFVVNTSPLGVVKTVPWGIVAPGAAAEAKKVTVPWEKRPLGAGISELLTTV